MNHNEFITTKENMNKLEDVQNRMGRIGLCANRMVGTETILGEMRWSSFEERILKGTLKYKT